MQEEMISQRIAILTRADMQGLCEETEEKQDSDGWIREDEDEKTLDSALIQMFPRARRLLDSVQLRNLKKLVFHFKDAWRITLTKDG